MNTITLAGNLGSDPEIKDAGGTRLAVLNLAVSQYEGPNKESTTGWWTVNLWAGMSKFADNLSKGDKVAVVGEVKIRKYKDKYYYDVNARQVFTPRRSNSGSRTTKPEPELPAENDDGLPF